MKTAPPLYIFDIDGTLANAEHRVHLVRDGNSDWDAFYDACVKDEPIQPVISVLKSLWQHHELWFFSGRDERVRDKTIEWLAKWVHPAMRLHLRAVPARLMMRPSGDYTADHVLKESWYQNMLDFDKSRLIAVFDDRDRVVAMWRRNGVQCFQCNYGDF